MRERAVMLGGKVEITSKPGDGTTVHARIPLDKAAAADGTRS
jgi:signal transduction histidine kinase